MNRRYPRYPDDADYQTNSPSYYEDLARKNKLIKKLAKRIWEYDKILADSLEEIEEVLRQVIDKIGEGFNEEIYQLLVKWVEDGTLDHIINETLMNKKADITYVDSEIERLDQKDAYLTTHKADKTFVDELNENLTEQLAQMAVNVKQFGATGDGVTDDRQSIQDAVDSVHETGGQVFFPEGDYLIKDTIYVNQSNIKLVGVPGAVIYLDPSMSLGSKDAKYAIDVYTNNIKSIQSLRSNGQHANYLCRKNDEWIGVNDVSNVNVGDLVFIKGHFSTSPWTSQNRGSAVKGETNYVIDVNENTHQIRLMKGLSDEWELNEIADVEIVEPLNNVIIDNIHIKGEGNRVFRGIRLGRTFEGTVKNCTVEGTGIVGIESRESYKNMINDNLVNNAWAGDIKTSDLASTGLAYGIRAVNDTMTSISRNRINHARHTVDISGGYPCRLVVVENNIVSQLQGEYGNMSTHGASEGTVFRGNVINGGQFGIVIRGENTLVHDNIMRNVVRSVYLLNGRNVNMYDNDVDGQVTITPSDTNVFTNYTIIKNNIFRGVPTPLYLIDLDDLKFNDIYNLDVSYNKIISNAVTTTYVIHSDYTDGQPITLQGYTTIKENSLIRTSSITKMTLREDSNVSIGRWAIFQNDTMVTVNEPANANIGQTVFLKDIGKPIWKDHDIWVNANGVNVNNRQVNQQIEPNQNEYIITFDDKEKNQYYGVTITTNWDTTYWVTDKTVNGFTIHFGTAPVGNGRIDWFIQR